jgi:hypothetical protein
MPGPNFALTDNSGTHLGLTINFLFYVASQNNTKLLPIKIEGDTSILKCKELKKRDDDMYEP